MYEIDLHFMCSETALKLFIEKYNNIYRSGYRGEIKIIHGYGSSSLNSTDIIRQRIRSFLLRNKENLKSLSTEKKTFKIQFEKNKFDACS